MHNPSTLPSNLNCKRSVLAASGGFSLIELSVVVLVVTLLLGGILVPLGAQIDQRRFTETEKQVEQIKEALIGFALANDYLPCPAKSATDGTEDREPGGTTCTLVSGSPKRIGFLPWVTLGLTPYDSWDNLYRYSVASNFTNSNALTLFGLTSAGDITIRTRDQTGTLVNLSNVNLIPVVVMSYGKNGYGAIGRGGVARFSPVSWTGDEQTNSTSSTVFVRRPRTDNTEAAGGEFDDIVEWITPSILFSRMVSAGKLP